MTYTCIDVSAIFASLMKYLTKTCLFQCLFCLNSHIFHSIFLPTHCSVHRTETPLLKLVIVGFISHDKGKMPILYLLDIYSVFDTIFHYIPVHSIHIDLGFTDKVLK